MSLHLYGIPNCDSVRKARAWLESRELAYAFHDFRKEGVDREKLEEWIAAKGVDIVLNRRGTTFRKLPDPDKQNIDATKAVMLLQEHTSMIKRPVLEHDGGLLVGFDPDEWEAALR